MMNFKKEREKMVNKLIEEDILHLPLVIKAMKKVKRELFVAENYKLYSYVDEPLPIPPFTGKQTISAPHTYPMFYEALELNIGDKFLEIGTGSGYGAALAREIVGKSGKVITIESNEETFKFAKNNLKKAGYRDIVIILGDGSEGYEKYAPYNKICVTASCEKIPQPLIKQLANNGKIVIPIGPVYPSQKLVLIEKDFKGIIKEKIINYVIYVPLIGKYGYKY